MRYGKWEIIRELGSGGQGKVFLARDVSGIDLGQIFPVIRQSIVTLSAQDSPNYEKAAQNLGDYLNAYFGQSAIVNCKALKVMHKNIKNNNRLISKVSG